MPVVGVKTDSFRLENHDRLGKNNLNLKKGTKFSRRSRVRSDGAVKLLNDASPQNSHECCHQNFFTDNSEANKSSM